MAYASPYYDPQKAHDYYMKHRHLKGRRSTSGLNEQGKAAARYVKEQLQAEKKEALEKAKKVILDYVDRCKERIEQIKQMKQEAQKKLREEQDAINQEAEAIRSMPNGPAKEKRKAELKKRREVLKGKRAKNKERNNELKEKAAKIRANTKAARSNLSDYKKKLKEHYDNKYQSELDRIKSDTNMNNTKKTKGGG